jgi:predicted nucleic acid-binding protein
VNGFLFDTCFLVDLYRELGRPGWGAAHRFLEEHGDRRPWVCWTVVGELAEGFGDIDHPACQAMIGGFDILPTGRTTAQHYAVVAQRLRRRNELIGTNDLWIAASALAHESPLVTRNASHFSRVEGLLVVTY